MVGRRVEGSDFIKVLGDSQFIPFFFIRVNTKTNFVNIFAVLGVLQANSKLGQRGRKYKRNGHYFGDKC